MTRRTFRAMGTEIELLAEADEDAVAAALAAAEAEFHRLEALLSRFRPESELSRLNETGELEAGPDLRRVVELALAAREQSGGRFDPTVHDAVVAAGYDRSFDDLAARNGDALAEADGDGDGDGDVDVDVDVHLHRRGQPPAARDVLVDGSRLSLRGVRIDLGGIGKGYAAERAAEILGAAAPCLVNAGGDIATRGGSWTVGIETAAEPLTLELGGGWALATSGRDRRRWTRDGRELHHLIDPRTGEPSASDLVRVTVVAPDAVDAEVAAKSLFLAGADAATAEADAAGIPAVLVTADHRTLLAGGLA